MSIDTVAEWDKLKRRSAASFKPIIKAPLPDGKIEPWDRAHISWVYCGFFSFIGVIALTLWSRSLALSLDSRSLALTLPSRSLSLTLPTRS